MSAIDLAEKLDAETVKTVKIDILHNDAAAMLRKQDAAIKQLREALDWAVWCVHFEEDDMPEAYAKWMQAKAALAATEESK